MSLSARGVNPDKMAELKDRLLQAERLPQVLRDAIALLDNPVQREDVLASFEKYGTMRGVDAGMIAHRLDGADQRLKDLFDAAIGGAEEKRDKRGRPYFYFGFTRGRYGFAEWWRRNG